MGRIPSLEVVMRPPSVFVRDLLPEEGNRLKRLSRKAATEVKRERALIVWAWATRMSPERIAAGGDRVGVGEADESAADRGAGGQRRVARAQGHSRVQRAGVPVAGP